MNPSRLLLAAGCLLVLASACWGQTSKALAELEEDLIVLRVARGLDLSTAQIEALTPLLTQAQTLIVERNKAQLEAWKTGQPAISAVNAAWEANSQPGREVKAQADQAVKAYDQLRDDHATAVRQLTDQFTQTLYPAQRQRLESAREAEVRQQNRARFQGAPSAAHFIAEQVALLRKVMPSEYTTIRLPMAMHLALALVDDSDPRFNDLVNRLTQIEDTVRRMPEATYTAQQGQLPLLIAQGLGLPTAALGGAGLIPAADILIFMTCPRTATLLKTYVPTPPPTPPAAPAPAGGGQP